MTRIITYTQALNEALQEEMERDQRVFIYGEDVGVFGGDFRVTGGLHEKFPGRVLDTPISEPTIVGGAVGAAITGMRPVVDLGFADFIAVAMDEIYNKLAKWRYMHGGHFTVPVVIRLPMGAVGGAGPEHSQCPEGLVMNCPGLKIAVPSTPYDAKGLLKTAIRDNNPVLFFEHKVLYQMKGEVPLEDYTVPFGKAAVRRQGADVTVIATALMVHRALEVAGRLQSQGIDVEVIDPRTLFPLDEETLLESVRKTGRVLILHEGHRRGGIGAELAALIAERALFELRAPVQRLAWPDVPVPQNAELERFVIPQVEDVTNSIRTLMQYS